MQEYGLLINGSWRSAEGSKVFHVTNPSTGEVVGTVADASLNDVVDAITAANAAFSAWAATTAKERSVLLRRLYDLMLENCEDMARLMTAEQGKPLFEARSEVQYAADFILWYSEEAKRVYGEIIPSSHHNKRIWVTRQPVGVVAAITPWNFPAAMITRKIGPALAAGCTVIMKPAGQTPLTAAMLAKLTVEAGFPPGVVNLITGTKSAEIADTLMFDRRVRKISFTGSTGVGKILIRKSAETVKRLSLELGGHAPFIVFEDADLDTAVQNVIASKFRNAGQTCICTNRVYVQESVIERFSEMLAAQVSRLTVGDGMDPNTVIGPLIDEDAVAKVSQHVSDALSKGATLVTGGATVPQKTANFYAPTVLSNVSDDMLIMNEETFGPVIPVQSFRTEDEAVSKANDTDYGLAAYVFTNDISRGIRVSERLEYGIVGLNDGMPSVAQAPFGGFKESGIGREGGKYGIQDYLEVKYVSVGLKV